MVKIVKYYQILCDHKIPLKLKEKFYEWLLDKPCLTIPNVGRFRNNIFKKWERREWEY